MQASVILGKARYTLSDTGSSPRWTDTRLLSLLNDALLDLALTTRLFLTSGYIRLENSVTNYDISDSAISIERVEYSDEPLPLLSMREMDNYIRNINTTRARVDSYYSQGGYLQYNTQQIYDWQSNTGRPEAIIYDKNKAGQITVYPIPEDIPNTTTVDESTLSGMITDITVDSVDIAIEPPGMFAYGAMSVEPRDNFLEVFYIKKPTVLTAPTNDIDSEVDTTVAMILHHYVAGHALRDNMDTQDRKTGAEELGLYAAGKMDLVKEQMSGHVERTVTTQYNPLGV